MRIREFVDQSSAITEIEAPSISPIDPGEDARVSVQGAHLFEDGEKHELPERYLLAGQAHQLTADAQRDCNDFHVADVRLQGGFNAMGADDEQLLVGTHADEHATIEPRRRSEVSARQRPLDLRFNQFSPRLSGATAIVGQELEIVGRYGPNTDLVGCQSRLGMPSGIAMDGVPLTVKV